MPVTQNMSVFTRKICNLTQMPERFAELSCMNIRKQYTVIYRYSAVVIV